MQGRYRVEIIPRQASVAIFDRSAANQINYTASCNVFLYGDVGCMYTINGSQFYAALAEPGQLAALMASLGVKTLEGYVTPAHARLMRAALRRVAHVVIRSEGEMAGHNMVWVVVTANPREGK